MARPQHDPSQRRPRGPEDVWVDGPHGRFWGANGAAGLLIADRDRVLLQLRAVWSHLGGTWGIPGGARKGDETPEQAALREADEEAGVPPTLVDVLGTSVFDLGYWSYTTVLARAREPFEPFVGDAESVELRWIAFDEVDDLPLHPGFAASWVDLRPRLEAAG